MGLKMKTKITFGIPVYNAEHYIDELLDCFEHSVNIEYEILIVNDGSTDNSLQKCMSRTNNKIRIINQENQGVSVARNRIIKEAKGEWIVFVDADDLIDFRKYIEVLKKINKMNGSFFINIDDIKKYNILDKKKEKVSFLIETGMLNAPWNKFYKADFLRTNHIEFDKNISLGEDALFNIECAFFCKVVKFICEKMYFMRVINSNSLSRKFKNNTLEELMYVNDKSRNFIKNKKQQSALDYIRVLNCRSCINDVIKFYNHYRSDKDIYIYIKNLKRNINFKILFFSNFKMAIKYYSFILCPAVFILIYIKKMTSNINKK